MEVLEGIRNKAMMELEEFESKSNLNQSDYDKIYVLVDIVKDIYCIEDNGEMYSKDGDWYAEGNYSRDGMMSRNSYNRGNSYARRGEHWVRGHYSRDGASVTDDIREMMNNGNYNSSEKATIEKAMKILNR